MCEARHTEVQNHGHANTRSLDGRDHPVGNVFALAVKSDDISSIDDKTVRQEFTDRLFNRPVHILGLLIKDQCLRVRRLDPQKNIPEINISHEPEEVHHHRQG